MNRILLALLLLPITTFSQTLAPPTISHVSGFYTDSFYVKITHPDPDVTILYTLDGSEPRIENLTGKVWNYKKVYPTNPGDAFGVLLQDTMQTYEYTDSILVRDRSGEQDRYADISTSYYMNEDHMNLVKLDSNNVFKGSVLRVVAYADNNYSSVLTRNYYVTHLGSSRYSLPVVSIAVDPESFFSYERGLYVPGILFDEWRNSNPLNQGIYGLWWADANFRSTGDSSEIPVNFTYIKDGVQKLNYGSGIRLHGNGSRASSNRSIRLYARSEYGVNNFNYPFFKNYSQSKFKRLILRNSGNDSWKTMFRDAFVQQASKKMNVGIQEYEPTILFINGEYFGLYNLRERFDDKYFKQIYDIDEGSIDLIENLIVEEGDEEALNSLFDYLNGNSLEDSNNFEYVSRLVDIKNITDYFLIQIFISNSDWPANNHMLWRKKVTYDSTAAFGHDGRWRWLLKDLDLSFGHSGDGRGWDYNDLMLVSNPSTNNEINLSTLIFRNLLKNDSYRVYFINRFSDILNTSYKPDVLIEKITEIKNRISIEMQEVINRWNPINQPIPSYSVPYSYSNWEDNVNLMINFSEERPYYIRSHIRNRFDAGVNRNVILGVSDVAHGTVKINTIEINEETDGIYSQNPYPWSGVYFKNVPIILKALPKEGYKFSHWSGEINDTVEEVTLLIDHDIYVKANFIEEIIIVDNPDTTDTDSLSVTYGKMKNNNIVLYPNPATDYINVLSDAQDMNYEIVTVDGRLISLGVMKGTKIELLNMEKGEYILRLFNDREVAVKKFAKY